jgi:signal transduction histidine kinase
LSTEIWRRPDLRDYVKHLLTTLYDAPLFSRSGEPLGVISTYFREPNRPSDRELCFTDLYARIEIEHRAILPEGSVKYVHALGHPVLNESGEIIEFIGTAADITDRRLATEALHKLQSELAHFARLTTMGELVAAIAHEVNQPLGAIANNAAVALRIATEANDQNEFREILSDIATDAARASAIIARIRTMVMRSEPEKEALQLNGVLRDVLALAKRELTERGIAIITDRRSLYNLQTVRDSRTIQARAAANDFTFGARSRIAGQETKNLWQDLRGINS